MKKWTRLSDSEIDELLATYRSQRKQLNYQLGLVKTAIKDLKETRLRKDEIAQERAERRALKPRKSKRKPGRRKKRTVVGGYRLNNYDQFIIDTITSNDRLMKKSEIVALSKDWANENSIKGTAADRELMITRSLNKLSGKRHDIGKHRPGVGMGLHYGIGEWFFANTGKLKAVYNNKVPTT